jgi:beta-lactam-binding protein with PASTA domain
VAKKFKFFQSFWANLLAAFIIALLLIFGALQMLSRITKHGQHLTVPAVVGKSAADVIQQLTDSGFDVVIVDSIYTDTLPKGIVLKQLPDANATVKVNRTIYLTTNRMVPPQIPMPDLLNKNYIFAIEILKKAHLQIGDTIFKPDFMKGSVMEQRYNGSKIPAGTQLQWGSKVTLVVASGLQETNLAVPNLLGMKFSDAKALLESMGIAVATAPDPDVKDTGDAYIYKQNPEPLDAQKKTVFIKAGMFMDVWLSNEMKSPSDSTTTPQ